MIETLSTIWDKVDFKLLLTKGLRLAIIIIIAMVILAAVKILFKRLVRRLVEKAQDDEAGAEDAKRIETLTGLLLQGIRIAIYAVALLIGLSEIGVDIGPVLASVGILGLAVGFGAQNLVRDIISGFFIVLENQVRVGDVAVVNGTGGLVERLNLRTIVLRDLAGTVHVFANGTITTLANMTKGWSGFVLDIGVAYKEDTDRVVEVMKQVGKRLREDAAFGSNMVEDMEIFGVDKFDDSAVVIKGRLKTKPIKQWEVGREYLRRLKMAFDKQGIEIPFPHVSLYFGEASKPLAVQLAEKSS